MLHILTAMETEDTTSFSSGKIVRLRMDSKNSGRVHVVLDSGLEFFVSLLEGADLKPEQVLSSEQVQRFYSESRFKQARSDAFALLSRRERSRREVQTHLLKKGYAKPTVARVLDCLEAENYLDDDRFCTLWIRSRQRIRPKGAYALRCELKQKGIGDEMIQRHIEQVDEESAAWDAVRSKLKQWAGLDRRRFVARAGGFLQRRGFGSHAVRRTIDRAWHALTGAAYESLDDSTSLDA